MVWVTDSSMVDEDTISDMTLVGLVAGLAAGVASWCSADSEMEKCERGSPSPPPAATS